MSNYISFKPFSVYAWKSQFANILQKNNQLFFLWQHCEIIGLISLCILFIADLNNERILSQ